MSLTLNLTCKKSFPLSAEIVKQSRILSGFKKDFPNKSMDLDLGTIITNIFDSPLLTDFLDLTPSINAASLDVLSDKIEEIKVKLEKKEIASIYTFETSRAQSYLWKFSHDKKSIISNYVFHLLKSPELETLWRKERGEMDIITEFFHNFPNIIDHYRVVTNLKTFLYIYSRFRPKPVNETPSLINQINAMFKLFGFSPDYDFRKDLI